MRSVLRHGLAVILAATAFGTPLVAQQASQSHVVDFHVNVESENQSVGGSVHGDSRFSLAFKNGPTYEFGARVMPGTPQTVAITIFRNDSRDGSGSFRRVETVHARVGVPTPLTSIPKAAVVVDRVRLATRRAPRPSQVSFQPIPAADAASARTR